MNSDQEGARHWLQSPRPRQDTRHLKAGPSGKSNHSNTKYTSLGTCPHTQTDQADRAQRRTSPAGQCPGSVSWTVTGKWENRFAIQPDRWSRRKRQSDHSVWFVTDHKGSSLTSSSHSTTPRQPRAEPRKAFPSASKHSWGQAATSHAA